MGTSLPAMVMTGASRWSKARCDTWLAMKSPTEDCGKPSSTTTSRLVFLTDAMMVSKSSGVSVAFVVAVFVSNVPEGVAGTASLRATGATDRRILTNWATLVAVSSLFAGLGFLLADVTPEQGIYVEAFAGGAVLTVLADSMMPEAFRHGGRAVGLLTVLGYIVAGTLSVLQ